MKLYKPNSCHNCIFLNSKEFVYTPKKFMPNGRKTFRSHCSKYEESLAWKDLRTIVCKEWKPVIEEIEK